MKLTNGEVTIIDDLLPVQQQIRLYVEACTLPYQLAGSNKFDVQDIKTQKPISYVNEKWVVENSNKTTTRIISIFRYFMCCFFDNIIHSMANMSIDILNIF